MKATTLISNYEAKIESLKDAIDVLHNRIKNQPESESNFRGDIYGISCTINAYKAVIADLKHVDEL